MTASISKKVAICSAIVLFLCWLASRCPGFVESVYSERFFPLAIRVLTTFSSPLPFSLGEVMMGLAGIWLLGTVIWAAARIFRPSKGGNRVLRQSGLRLAAAILFVLAFGYLFWGLNYAREEASARLGWERAPAPPDGLEELIGRSMEAVEQANSSYLAAFGTPDRGEGSPPVSDPKTWDQGLDAGFAATAARFGLGPPFGAALGRAKPFWGSSLLCRLGISGFYFPWTGEANYNQLTPVPERIHAIAHEKSHQRGIASEDEASFFGFLACVLSPTPQIRYAGWLFAQRQLLNQLSLADLESARTVAARRLPGVRRDEAEIRRFWKSYQGTASEVGAAVNNTYLRLHGVAGGVDSYNRAARLLVLMARAKGTLVLQPESQTESMH